MKNYKSGFTVIECLVAVAIFLAVFFAVFQGVKKAYACGNGWFESACGTSEANQKKAQETVSQQQARLVNAVPIPRLDSSLERENISRRLQLFSAPDKVSYIYLISYGRVMAFYAVKGKITSGQKRLTPDQEQVGSSDCSNGSSGANCNLVMSAPELDGTYGASSPYIFFWTTDGVYVQWNGEYMMADQPLKMATQPELIMQVK